MSKILFLFLAVMFVAVALPCPGAGESFSNGYFSLHAREGWFDEIRFDPSGQGKYGQNLVKSLCIGELPCESGRVAVRREEDGFTFHDLKVRSAFTVERTDSAYPFQLKSGSTLGVKFTVPSGKVTQVGAKLPTWHTSDSGCTITLYSLPGDDMARKTKVATAKLTNVKDNSTRFVECEPRPAGTYYLEISDPVGTIGWWGAEKDANPDAVAYVDGEERSNSDLAIVYSGFNELEGDWTIKLDGPKLQSSFSLSDKEAILPDDIGMRMVTAWEKAGYDVSKFPFARFYTDTGRHVIPQQWKRRPHGHIQHGKWVYAMGRGNYDLRFSLADGGRLAWEFGDDYALWKIKGATLDLDMLPHNPRLPDYYPEFYSSDRKLTDLVNEFYYSHALNFGVGTPPDWKEWQALILDWTASPQRTEQRGHFTGVSMGPDGYVYTWGGEEGWPFPHKDEDKDGKNDYDTRHFTTNPCFILGAYRYFVWSRDLDFLKEIMPKLRSAMAFDLDKLRGRNGIIVIDAKGHEGKADGIGSNYWDILPFGYKDAFSNSYYYAAIQAMAELEEFCKSAGLDLPGKAESPVFYKRLRDKVRKSYNNTFWDPKAGRYVGCVDVDGVKHDYGFTFVNLEAMAYGLPDKEQAERIYKWMETEPTSSGKADTYTKWVFAPRANTIHNPPREPSAVSSQQSANAKSEIRNPESEIPSWWHFGWAGTPYGEQCQDGGAILYTSGYDIMARAKYLGPDNALQRLREILGRYSKPDRLMGGNPLCTGETSQGGGNGAGSVGVEGEFPESGLVPASFLYAFLGINADIEGLKIRPNLPSSLKYAGVRGLCYAGQTYDIRVTMDTVEVTPFGVINPVPLKRKLAPGETFLLIPSTVIRK